MNRLLLVGGGATWAVAAALVAAAALIGRARPWEGSLGYLLVFAAVGLLHAGLAWRWRSTGALQSGFAGLLAIGAAWPIYASDSWNESLANDPFLKGLTLAALLLPAALAGWGRAGRLRSWIGGVRLDAAWPVVAILMLAAAGLLDLLVKVAASAGAPAGLWLLVLPMLAVSLVVFGRATDRGLEGYIYLLPLLVPVVFAFLTHTDSQLRLLVLTSGGARLLTGLLLAVAVYAGWLLRPGTDSLATRVRGRLARDRGWLLTATLMGIGILQAGSYRVVAMDDLARYWLVADSVTGGAGYPAWAGGGGVAQAVEGAFWVDPPVFPLLLAGSFGIAGHWYHSAQIPIVLANVALPGALFLALRTLVSRDDIALAAALLTVLFPPFQVHLLGAAEPDALFVLELVIAMGLLARAAAGRGGPLALGTVLLLLALTRPEGPVYAAVLAMAAAAFGRSRRWLLPGAMALAGVAAFAALVALTTDATWPSRGPGFSLANLGENLDYLRHNTWWYYGRVLLLDDLRAPLLLVLTGGLFAVGCWTAARGQWLVAALLAALLANLGLTLAVDPDVLRAAEPAEMFRHLGYGLPVVAAMAAIGAREVLRWKWRANWTGSLLAVIVVALIGGEIYVLATPEEMYHWNKSGSLLRGGDIYVEAVELFQNPIALPCRDCADAESFREQLFDNYRPFDMHGDTVGISYSALTGVLSAVALGVALAAGRRELPEAFV